MTEPGHSQAASRTPRVVIAGGGVAGLEALIALHALAGDRVAVTLVAPTETFYLPALSVEDPFARPSPRRYSLERACTDHGAGFVQDALQAVDRDEQSITTRSGETIGYDSLLVAVGALAVPVFDHVATFRGLQDAEAMHGLVQDVEGGYVQSIAFVVPPGVTWPLPLYELALMTAERAESMGIQVSMTILTPESGPLEVFGRSAAQAVEGALAERGIVLVGDTYVRAIERGTVIAGPGDVEVPAQRIVTVPRLTGPGLRGVPGDQEGFLPVDDHGRVLGTTDVFAAGDGTTFPVKQGGLAAQQAGAAARAIARRAGVEVADLPFRPVLRAKLLTGSRALYLRHAVAGGTGDGGSQAADQALWWPPTKVVAPYLAPYLERLDQRVAR